MLAATPFTDADRRFMTRALRLARRGEGLVEPNPMVGCVLVKKEKIIGEGFHRRFGGVHAERQALKACHTPARGATAYVTLEPCCHYGKTPPCTDALIEAGVSRVIAATTDPNEDVSGGGADVLRRSGMKVDVGLQEDDARELIAPFATLVLKRRPYVIAKWAQSLDGKLATTTGHSQWITGEESRRRVHQIRARVDAILIGSGTLLADDPLLTARNVGIRRQATRIVLDARLNLHHQHQLVQSLVVPHAPPVMVFTTPNMAKSSRAAQLEKRGVRIVGVKQSKDGRLSIPAILKRLGKDGMTNLLLEGGPTVLSSFFTAGLVDEAHVYIAPMLIGGRDAPSPLQNLRIAKVADAITPQSHRIRRMGEDQLHVLRFDCER